MKIDSVFDRQMILWGAEGQRKLGATRVAIVGLGGLGSHVAQQTGYIGIGGYCLIDSQKVDRTNLNRLVGAFTTDIDVPKVEIASRMLSQIRPGADVEKVAASLVSPEAFAGIKKADVVLGCVDDDAVRFILMELCSAYDKPYLDLASDIDAQDGLSFGGRLAFSIGGRGCLHCWDMLDQKEIDRGLSTLARVEERKAIYGVDSRALELSGPSVVCLNGTIASLGVTELMCFVTGLRPPISRVTYYGQSALLTKPKDLPAVDCYYCKDVFRKAEAADVERYLSQDLPYLK